MSADSDVPAGFNSLDAYGFMRPALSDPNLPGQYIRKNQQDAVTEEMGLYDYGAAAATGLYHGLTLSLPEQYMRVVHRFATWFDAEDAKTWAREKLDEYRHLRENDPTYQPDEKWMASYYGKSIYQGFNSLATSAGLMLPGLALMPLTGGLGGGILGSALLGTATSAGTLAGVAEFDNFIDEAYSQLKAINPHLTREEIEDEHFWNAAYSGLAEGGFEFASDVLGGKLIGMFGKAGAEPARHIISKLFRNTARGMISEVPSELATAAMQDWIKEFSGLNYQGRVQAMAEALGPSLITGGAFGAIGTAAKEIVPQQQPMSPKDVKDFLNNTVSGHQAAQLQDFLGDEGYKFYAERLSKTEGMTPEQAKALAALGNDQATRWAQENGRDKNEWWAGRNQQIDIYSGAGWSDTLAVAQALVTPDASFESVVHAATDTLWNGVPPEQREALLERYGVQDESGQIGIDRARFENDFLSWLKDPKSVELDGNAAETFGAMRDNLLDSYNAVKQTGGVRISNEAQGLFEAAFQRLGKRELKQPNMYVPADPDQLRAALTEIATNDSATNEQIADAFAKSMKFNFNPWTVGDDVKATFAAFDKSLAPLLEPLLKRQNDAQQDARAKAEMTREGYTEAGVQSLFEDAVSNEEGSLSYRLRKAQIYQTLALKNIQQLAQEYSANPTPQSGVALRMASAVYADIHAQMRGLRSESGRALRVWRNAGKDQTLDIRRINEMFENSGGQGMHDKIARLIGNATDLNGVKDVIEMSAWKKTEAMLIEHVTLGMLTNPATQIVNVAGNGLTLLQETFNRLIGETTAVGDGGIAKGETMAMVNGFMMAMRNIRQTWGQHKQNYGGSWNAIKNIDRMQWDAQGSSLIDDVGMMDRKLTRENAQDVLAAASSASGLTAVADKLGMSSAHAKATQGLATAVEYYGRSLGIVSKALLTADQFFKTTAYHMELNARLHRNVQRMSGGDPVKFQEIYQQISKKPLKRDKEAALDFAKKVTFQSDLGGIGRNLNKMRHEVPLTRLVIPFLKTPINILKYGAAHTPLLSRMVGETRAELNSTDPAVRQLAEARVMTGTLLWTAALGLAAQGMLTGSGPADVEKRRKLEATGWRPNSLKIGDTYLGIDRLDPGAFIFNTAASFMEIAQSIQGDDLKQAFTAGLGAAIRTIAQRSYLQSVDNVFNAIMDFESTQGQRAVDNIITSIAVPASALSRTTARVIDPVAREALSTLDVIKSNLPGFSMAVPERRNFLGEVMPAPEMFGPDLLAPVRYSADNKNPVYAEIARLSQAGIKMPGMPQRTIQHQNKRVRLDAEQYSKLLSLSGEEIKIGGRTLRERLQAVVESPQYGRASDERKAALLEDTIQTYRKAAKKTMIRTDPGVGYLLGI